MPERINVLLIEDSEDDALLIVRELRHGGYDVNFKRIETSDAIREALAENDWDIILSDHAMPQICAPAALSIVKESGVDTPFIIVSGWMTDETARSAMKEGARDFVPKNRLSRLVPVVQRELKTGRKAKRVSRAAKSKTSKK